MSVQSKESRRTRVSEEQVERIYDAFERSPPKSTRRARHQLVISQNTVWRVLKKQLHMEPYILSLVQALTNDDKVMQRRFCESTLEMIKHCFFV